MENINLIKDNLSLINLELTDDKLNKLDQYVNLLKKWNKSYNLVGSSTLNYIYSRHLLDSLQLIQYIDLEEFSNNKILDFGSGAGIPSVILAIVLDNIEIVACERIGKKCQFLNQVRRELNLSNFKVVQDDVRNIKTDFDLITCRAVASINEILSLTSSLKTENQKYLLPKGCNYLEELKEVENNGVKFNYDCCNSVVDEESVILKFIIK